MDLKSAKFKGGFINFGALCFSVWGNLVIFYKYFLIIMSGWQTLNENHAFSVFLRIRDAFKLATPEN